MKKVSSIKRIDVKANPAGYIAGGLFIALILFTLFFNFVIVTFGFLAWIYVEYFFCESLIRS